MSVQKVSSAMLADSGVLPAWDGSALTGITSADEIAVVQTHIASNFFLDAVDSSRSIQHLSDGFVDQFEDQLGVDDIRSTNEVYNTSGDYYGPVGTVTAYETGDRSSTITVTDSGGFGYLLGQANPNYVNGGFFNNATDSAFPATGVAIAGFWVKFDHLGVYRLIDEAKFYDSNDISSGVWKWQGSNDDSAWTDIGSSFTLTGSATGAVLTSMNGNTVYYKYHRMLGVSGNMGTNDYWQEFEFKIAGPIENVTLVSEPSTALAVPTNAHVTLFKEDVDATTVNTDIIAWVSRNKKMYSSNFAVDNKLDATGHGLSNNDRVMVSTGYAPAVSMSKFDGNDDYMTISDAALGQDSTRTYTVSFWYKRNGAVQSPKETIITSAGEGFYLTHETNDKIRFLAKNSQNQSFCESTPSDTITAADGLVHFIMSTNFSNATPALRVKMAINGVLQTVTDTINPHDSPAKFFGTGTVTFGALNGGGSQHINADIGQFYLAEEYVDISVAENLAKFVTGTGAAARPVDLGVDGSTPTGNQPLIFLNNEFGTFQNNLGLGGNFTENSTINAGTDIIPDSLQTGLDAETVYHVVNKTINDFEVSLTSGGSAVTLTDEGLGFNNVHAVTAVTLTKESTVAGTYDIVSGMSDISEQPSGTDMKLVVQTKNTKNVKIHGQSLQWL